MFKQFTALFAKGGEKPGPRIKVKSTIYFIRHGQTDYNAAHRFQGSLDIPLNDTGRTQAARNGILMRETLGDSSGFQFIASPLWRARETMNIIRYRMGLAPERYFIDGRLAELSFGAWEGKTGKEINAETDGEFSRRKDDIWTHKAPDGESYQEAEKRIRDWLTDLEGDAIVVAHGGVGRVLRGLACDLSIDEMMALTTKQDCIYLLEKGQEHII